MSLGLRLLLAVLIAGCASQVLMVPDADWQTVPAAQRAAVDRQHEVDLAAARTELQAASASLAEFKRTPPAPAAQPPTPLAMPADPDDQWAAAMRDHERTRAAAFARVEAAKAEWLRTDGAWRQLRVETATTRLEMVICERELVRAQTIDRGLPGNDHYEVAPLRGQFSRAQQRWHAVAGDARQARIAYERASTTLASSKEAYAQLMRNGPAQLAVPPPSDAEERARLDLGSWVITRSDINRRRGLRHYLDTVASAPPQLRRSAFKLSPPPRWTTPPAATAAAPAPRGVQAPRPATADSTKPWDLVEPAGRTAAKPPAPAAAATLEQPKPAPAPPKAPPAKAPAATATLDQPKAPPAPAAKAPAATATLDQPKPAPAAKAPPATKAPPAPAEAPLTAAKPVAPPRTKPAAATPSAPTDAALTAKPVAPPRAKPAAATPSAPTDAALTAAKPVAQPRAKPASVPAPIRTRRPAPAAPARTFGPELPPGGLAAEKPAPRTYGPELPPSGAHKPARAKPVDAPPAQR